MSLPYPNPSLETATNPYFQDNDFARGVQLRNNNISIWGNLQYLLDAITNNLWTPGQYMTYAGTSAPTGWLACDGASYLRTDYAALFSVIGTTYGSVDGTHFNVPDIRGITFVGSGTSGSHLRADGTAYDGGTVATFRNDQFQGIKQNVKRNDGAVVGDAALSVTAGGTPVLVAGATQQYLTAEYLTDGINGTPRYGNETRPAQIAALVCIKI